jgi:hypothetical protein
MREQSSKSRSKVAVLGLVALLVACQSSRSETMPTKILAQSKAPISLGAGPIVVPLITGGKTLDAAASGKSLYLLVRGLTATEQPGVVYAVYLDLPVGATPAANDPRRVGLIQFYNARPPGAANAADAGPNTDAEKVFFSFEVTPAIRALRQRGELARATTVTLIPDGVPESAAKVLVGQFEIVEQ